MRWTYGLSSTRVVGPGSEIFPGDSSVRGARIRSVLASHASAGQAALGVLTGALGMIAERKLGE